VHDLDRSATVTGHLYVRTLEFTVYFSTMLLSLLHRDKSGKKLSVFFPVTSPTFLQSVTGQGGQNIKEEVVLQRKGNI
jgi:hypothetical protein